MLTFKWLSVIPGDAAKRGFVGAFDVSASGKNSRITLHSGSLLSKIT
jgi:hypothetical protein